MRIYPPTEKIHIQVYLRKEQALISDVPYAFRPLYAKNPTLKGKFSVGIYTDPECKELLYRHVFDRPKKPTHRTKKINFKQYVCHVNWIDNDESVQPKISFKKDGEGAYIVLYGGKRVGCVFGKTGSWLPVANNNIHLGPRRSTRSEAAEVIVAFADKNMGKV